MKYTHLFLLTLLFGTLYLQPQPVMAKEKISGASAILTQAPIMPVKDERVQKLENYLKHYNSPFAADAKTFVEEADKYGHDYRFVAAIAGLESGFGKHIPHNSYNAWGWGVYGTKVMRFPSWKDGIQTISRDLRMKYMNKWGARDIYAIGRIYAASPTWADRVLHFMDAIERFETKDQKSALSISL